MVTSTYRHKWICHGLTRRQQQDLIFFTKIEHNFPTIGATIAVRGYQLISAVPTDQCLDFTTMSYSHRGPHIFFVGFKHLFFFFNKTKNHKPQHCTAAADPQYPSISPVPGGLKLDSNILDGFTPTSHLRRNGPKRWGQEATRSENHGLNHGNLWSFESHGTSSCTAYVFKGFRS